MQILYKCIGTVDP